MSGSSLPDAWADSPWSALFLLLALILIALDLGRTTSRGLTVAVGAIRLGAPTLVPLSGDDATSAAQLLGGALEDYLATQERESGA